MDKHLRHFINIISDLWFPTYLMFLTSAPKTTKILIINFVLPIESCAAAQLDLSTMKIAQSKSDGKAWYSNNILQHKVGVWVVSDVCCWQLMDENKWMMYEWTTLFIYAFQSSTNSFQWYYFLQTLVLSLLGIVRYACQHIFGVL